MIFNFWIQGDFLTLSRFLVIIIGNILIVKLLETFYGSTHWSLLQIVVYEGKGIREKGKGMVAAAPSISMFSRETAAAALPFPFSLFPFP